MAVVAAVAVVELTNFGHLEIEKSVCRLKQLISRPLLLNGGNVGDIRDLQSHCFWASTARAEQRDAELPRVARGDSCQFEATC